MPNITNNDLPDDVFSVHTIINYESSFPVTNSTSTVARMGLKARRAAIGIGIFSDPVISNDYVKLLSLDYPSSGRGCIVNPVNSRCIDSSIRIENAHACTHRDFTYLSRALVALFDRGRSQNDYNNYFIRRGSGPLCLPILKVITRCLHTALRELLFGAPFCLGHDTRSAEPAAP